MSEKKKIKHKPGPSSSKFRFKLQNSSRSEESASSNGNTTPVRRFDKRSGHSTPIRNASVSANVENSPEIDHRCSPIMGPCTQQNEVIWNWNSPKDESNMTDVIRTPKRTAQLQKRRISDSPLMYAPLKVKLKKEESDVNVFMANFEQFSHPSAALKPEDESEPSTSENWHFESQNHLNSEKNLETSDEMEMRLVYPVDETRMETFSEKQNVTNLNDLFNDEIDDSMLRFSQQVEEKFLGPVKEEKLEATSSKSFHDKENKSTVSNNQGAHKIEGIQNLINVTLEKAKEDLKSPVRKEICITIPDDSFDECLSQFVEDDLNSLSKNVETPQNKAKGLQMPKSLSKKSLFHTGNKTGVKLGSARSFNILDSKKALNQNYNFTKTKSFEFHNETHKNVAKNLGNDFVQKNEKKLESHVSPRKFFKTKSLSEPFHDPITSIASNKNIQETKSKPSTENIRKLTGKSFKCRIYSDTSLNRSLGNSSNMVLGSSQESVMIGNNFDNLQTSNLNRSMEKLQGQRRTDSEEILCTPQEIERKRAEAKMKLEAKRRLLLSSKTTNSTSIFSTQKSVKR